MRASRFVASAALAVLLLLAAPAPAMAQRAPVLSTPYPAVAVEAGETTSFALRVATGPPQRVDLAVTEVPRGWTASLRGGGLIIDGVFTDPEEPPEVTLEVEVPPEASEGSHQVVVTATSQAGTTTLPLQLRVAEAVSGGVELATEFAQLQGASDATFNFNVELTNNTAEEQAFQLQTAGPEGWVIEARPAGEQQAATVTVGPGESAGIDVEVDPPDDVSADTYPIALRAVGGGSRADIELQVDITGRPTIELTTPTERLNATVEAGGRTDVALLVRNDGTAPLVDVTMESTPPADWEVAFSPETIPQVPPGEAAEVTATITASSEAIAGDYLVGLSASSPEVTDEIELRTSVETSLAWGLVGVLLIAGVLGGLGWVFRRYGRR